jgi:hypothetical protein
MSSSVEHGAGVGGLRSSNRNVKEAAAWRTHASRS